MRSACYNKTQNKQLEMYIKLINSKMSRHWFDFECRTMYIMYYAYRIMTAISHERDASTAKGTQHNITFKACRLSDRSGELRADIRVFIVWFAMNEGMLKPIEDTLQGQSVVHQCTGSRNMQELWMKLFMRKHCFNLLLTCVSTSKALTICSVPINYIAILIIK